MSVRLASTLSGHFWLGRDIFAAHFVEFVWVASPEQTESVLLLQRLFSFTQQGDRWADYTTSQWEAKDDTAPLQLLDTVRQAVSSVQSAKNVSQAKQDAMDIYFNAFDHTLRRGTDKEWQHIMEFLQSLEASAENEEDFDDILVRLEESLSLKGLGFGL